MIDEFDQLIEESMYRQINALPSPRRMAKSASLALGLYQVKTIGYCFKCEDGERSNEEHFTSASWHFNNSTVIQDEWKCKEVEGLACPA